MFGNKDFEARLVSLFGWEHAPSFVVIAVYFVLNGIFGITRAVASALGAQPGFFLASIL